MKILLVTTVDISRRDNGKKVVIGGISDFFLERGDILVDLVPGTSDGSKNLPLPSRLELVKSLLWDCFIKRRLSIQECFYCSRKLVNQLQQRLDEFKPDLVILDTIRISQFVTALDFGGAKVILYLDDLFSVRYERMIASPSLSGSPLGNFKNRLPSFATFFLDQARWALNLVLRFEADLVKNSEMRTVRLGFESYLISSEEVEHFNRFCFVAPNLREIPPNLSISSMPARRWDGSADFVFLGSLNLAHNISALNSLINIIFPVLLKSAPLARLKVIGGKADKNISELMELSPFVDYLGYVEDVASELAKCCAMVAPLDFGSGVKLKLIDALSVQLPIITTAVGMEGIAMVDGAHGRIVSGASGFPAAMMEALDLERNETFSRNCGILFETHYSTKAINEIYSGIFSV